METPIGRTVARGSIVAAIVGIACAIALAGGGCGSSSSNGGAGGSTGSGGFAFGSGGHDGGAAGSGLDAAGAQSDVLASTLNFAFLSDADGFALDTFTTPGPFTDGNPQNLGGALNLASPPAVTFDGANGMPSPGSLAITAAFTDFNQTVNVRRLYPVTATVSLAGKTITAQVRLDAGSTFTGTIHLMALSTPSPPRPAPGYLFAQGNSILLGDNNWHTLTFDLSVPEFAAAGFDPTDIVQIGVQLASGASAVTTPAPGDGGAASAYGAPQSLTVHFDSVTSN